MSIQNTKPSMVRYDDFIVKLYKISNDNSGSGSKFFKYVDPFKGTTSGGIVYPVTLERIIYSSDTAPTTLSGTFPDLSFSEYNNMVGGKEYSNNDNSNSDSSTPSIGWGISVDAKCYGTGSNSSSTSGLGEAKRIFKGYIYSISRQIGQNGIFYRFEARDIKSRLTCQTIKKVYNGTYKNSGIPIVGESKILSSNTNTLDKPYVSGNLTIGKILEDILNYAKKTSSNGTNKKEYSDFVGFKYGDFVFGGGVFNSNSSSDSDGSSTDKYLKNFVPPTISFDNITILEAIYKLINTAGPYRMVVDYAKPGSNDDKIYFFGLDNRCKNCGKEIKLEYGKKKKGDASKGFHQVNVISDTTTRKIQDACNIMKSYTGPVEWYSGHFYIEKGEDETKVRNNSFTKNGVRRNQLSCKNWDGYNYYFGLKSMPYGSDDSNSDNAIVIVGTPLYPAWDPNTGYEPYQRNFSTYFPDVEKAETELEKVDLILNSGITENDMKFIKHRNFSDAVGKDRIKNSVGVSYVAYAPYGKCEACDGTGAVSTDCSNGKYSSYFGNTRTISGDKKNYPSLNAFFSGGDYAKPSSDKEKEDGMAKYIGEEYTIPKKHPLPWKNTCPVCRGTGIEPWFKMGTILNSLVDISPSQVKVGETTKKRLGAQESNSGSLAIDKTYSQITEDMSYKYPVIVHVETATNYIAYSYATDATESNSSSFIKHPLADEKQIASKNAPSGVNDSAKIFPDGADGSTRGADNDSKYIQALYYTQIQDATGYQIDTDRSMVIFNNAMFIPCKAPMATVTETIFNNNIKAPGYDKKLKCFRYNQKGEMNGIGQNVGSFWRPSRAWITCYFKRDRFEHFYKTEKTITRKLKGNGSVDTDKYLVAPRIEDNRYCAEIRKKSTENNIEEFKVRPIAKGIFCDDIKWQVHPWDFDKMIVPSAQGQGKQEFEVPTDYSDMWSKNGVYESCKSENYNFPCGKILKFEKLREIEVRALAKSKADANLLLRSDTKGKIIAWAHKDERMKLFEKACAELERRNNIQISGTVTTRGTIPTFKGGLGWVTLYDGIKACVVKTELSFGTNFLMNLEVGTEELRVGQKKEADKDYDRLIQDKINDLNLNNKSAGLNGPVDTLDASDNVTVMGAISVGGGVEL